MLNLTLRKEWFDLIVSGEKKEEYREIKPYWDIRLKKKHDVIIFRNGYVKGVPEAVVELIDITKGIGRKCWGAPSGEEVYILRLGEIKSTNYLRNQKRIKTVEKEYIQKCEILRDGEKIGILDVSTKKGMKQRSELGRLRGYTFKSLPL